MTLPPRELPPVWQWSDACTAESQFLVAIQVFALTGCQDGAPILQVARIRISCRVELESHSVKAADPINQPYLFIHNIYIYMHISVCVRARIGVSWINIGNSATICFFLLCTNPSASSAIAVLTASCTSVTKQRLHQPCLGFSLSNLHACPASVNSLKSRTPQDLHLTRR